MLDLHLPGIARVRKLWRLLQIDWILSGPSAHMLTLEEVYVLKEEREKLQQDLEIKDRRA